MLIKRWEKLRGVDRWPEVKAVFRSEDFSYGPTRSGGANRLLGWLTFEYRASDGVLRTKTIRFFALGSNSLSSLTPGDEFWVRCSPQDASRVYVRECTKGNLMAGLGITIVILALWMRERYRAGH